MDQAVADYVDSIREEFRPLFDRIHALVLAACPQADVVISYKIPTYKVGRRRLLVGVWQHGVSIYGWKHHGDGGFTTRHPELQTSVGTIRLRPEDSDGISDDEIRGLARAALTDTS